MSSLRGIETLADGLGRPCLIPLVHTTHSCPNPAKFYFNLRRTSWSSYLLESAEGPGEDARYSVIGCDPLLHIKVRGSACEVNGRQDLVDLSREFMSKSRGNEDALEVFKKGMLVKKMKVSEPSSRYMLGVVGYLSYDLVRSFVDIGSDTLNDLNQPQLEFMLPERMVIFDHIAHKTRYCSLLLLLEDSDLQEAYEQAESGLKELVIKNEVNPQSWAGDKISARSNVTKGKYEDHVNRIKRYIRAGDVIQAVLSRRIELTPSPPLERFFLNLRKLNPSPYMFFLDFPERSIVGSSPEILVKVNGRRVVTRPIAGTRPRGKSKADEKIMEMELRADEKERAEHIMLVDLGRNDLGRVAKFGSVRVTSFMDVEKYSHVQHLVTSIEGELQDGDDAFDALRATFPAGTVTGAPKVRAMEIIEELEPTRRGIYAGAIGSFSYMGDADLAIAIRTLIAEQGKGYVQVGAGIVADSLPSREYSETMNKARALLCAAGV